MPLNDNNIDNDIHCNLIYIELWSCNQNMENVLINSFFFPFFIVPLLVYYLDQFNNFFQNLSFDNPNLVYVDMK